jgi:hypothetical protein
LVDAVLSLSISFTTPRAAIPVSWTTSTGNELPLDSTGHRDQRASLESRHNDYFPRLLSNPTTRNQHSEIRHTPSQSHHISFGYPDRQQDVEGSAAGRAGCRSAAWREAQVHPAAPSRCLRKVPGRRRCQQGPVGSAERTLRAAQHSHHDRRSTGRSGERVCIPPVLIGSSLQIPTTGSSHLAAPTLGIHELAVI